MRRRGLQRLIVLAAAVLLGVVAFLAVREHTRHTPTKRALPSPAGSYTALAGSSGPAAYGKRTTCGVVIGPETVGVANPVLPCGVRLYISYRGTSVLTEVIDQGPRAAGREFDVTEALARKLGLSGVRTIHWSYAGAG